MKAICCICKKEFDRKPSLLKRAKHPTCSKECRNKMYAFKKVKVKCVICGKEIEMLESRLKYQKEPTCSKKCYKEKISRRMKKDKIKLKCPVCKKYFEVHPYRIKSQLVICCSRKCSYKYNYSDKTKHPRYNKNITDEEREKRRKLKENVIWRNKVFEKDNYTCNKCKQYGGKLEAHHLNGYNWDKENRFNIDNGITLCQRCHKEFHKKYGAGDNTKEQYLEYANQT